MTAQVEEQLLDIGAPRELDQGLTRVKEHLTAMKVEDAQLPEIAEALGSMGRRMVLILFENAPNVLRELQAFWNAAVPAWRNAAYVPIVECLGDEDHMIPPAMSDNGRNSSGSCLVVWLRQAD